MPSFVFQLTSDAAPPHICTTDPVGWQEMKYSLVRDTKYHGVAFEVSLQLTFVKAAGNYIKTLYEAYGPEVAIRLTVFEQNPNELRFEEVHTGRLDMTTYKALPVGVSVTVAETTLASKLQNQDDVQVDLLSPVALSGSALPAASPAVAVLHSQQLPKRFEAVMGTTPTAAYSGIIFDSDSRGSVLYFGFGEVKKNEFNFPITSTLTDSNDEPIAAFPITEAGAYTFDLRIRFKDSIHREGSNGDFDKVQIRVYFRVNNGAPQQLAAYVDNDVDGPVDAVLDGTYQGVHALAAGDRVYLYAFQQVQDVHGNVLTGSYQFSNQITVLSGSYLRISATTTTAATSCNGVLVHEAYQRVLSSMTGQNNIFYSDYFGRTDSTPAYAVDGSGALRMVTNGYWLSGFPISTSTPPAEGEVDYRKGLFCSLSDLFSSTDATDCLGMSTELVNGRPVVRIEPRAFYYPTSVVLALGSVTELSKSVAPEHLYGTAEVGFTTWKPAANETLEFNGKRSYTLPLTITKNSYTALSPYIGGGYLIEEARRNRFDLATAQDSKADDNNYLICLRRSGGLLVAERDEAFAEVTGIPNPSTAYNLRLSPGRSLRRHGAFLQPTLYRRPAAKVRAGAVEGFNSLSTQLTTETTPVDERADVLAAELPARLFAGEVYEFTVQLRWAQLKSLRARPYGRISFLDNLGQRLSGYLQRLDYSPATRRAEFKLLRAD